MQATQGTLLSLPSVCPSYAFPTRSQSVCPAPASPSPFGHPLTLLFSFSLPQHLLSVSHQLGSTPPPQPLSCHLPFPSAVCLSVPIPLFCLGLSIPSFSAGRSPGSPPVPFLLPGFFPAFNRTHPFKVSSWSLLPGLSP